MFRYEINSVFKKHQFQDDKDSGLMMGRHPLSRASDGQQLKNCKLEDLEQYQDRYRPPGIVKVVEKYMVPEKTDKDEEKNSKASKEQKGPIYGVA